MVALVVECIVADLNKLKISTLDILNTDHVDVNLGSMRVAEVILWKERVQNWVFSLNEILHVSQTVVPE